VSVEVRFLGIFEETFGRNQIYLAAENPRKLREVIIEVAKSSPELGRLLIDPELLDPRPNAVILVNGKEIGVLQGLETEVKSGDKIVLIPVIHGG